MQGIRYYFKHAKSEPQVMLPLNPLPVTLLTTCKPFVGTDSIMQENALSSWRHLGFNVVIIGQDKGVKEACQRHDCLHIPVVKTGSKNLPLISDIFDIAENIVKTSYYAYINSDIILDRKIIKALSTFFQKPISQTNLLLTTRRRNVPVYKPLNFKNSQWENDLSDQDLKLGTWDHSYAIDFFLVNKGWLKKLPDLMIGRAGWDNWMLYNAQINNVNIIDASADFTIYHPLHGYSVTNKTTITNTFNTESLQNKTIIGKINNSISNSATHYFSGGNIIESGAQDTEHFDKLYKVNLEKLFHADIRVFTATNLSSSEQKIERLYTILDRSLQYFSHLLTNQATNQEIDVIVSRIIDDCKKNEIKKAMHLLQDFLLAAFLLYLRKITEEKRPIYIWGTGQAGQRLHNLLVRHNIPVQKFLDSKIDSNKPEVISIGTKKITVRNPNVLKKNLNEKPFILLASMYFNEMQKYLVEHDYKKEIDFLY